MAFSFAVLAPVALQEPLRSHKRTLERCWKGVLSIGACMALNIALNKITGTWNEQLLADLIVDLQSVDFNVDLTGFEAPEVEQLFSKVYNKKIKEDDFDVDGELEKPTVAKAGDIWLLGDHRVICGDATLPETYERLMVGKKANMVLTDPPYNVDVEETAGKIRNDNMPDDKFYQFLFAAFVNMEQNMEQDASIYVFHADTQGLNFRKAFKDAGFYLSGCCIWKKNALVLGRSPDKGDSVAMTFAADIPKPEPKPEVIARKPVEQPKPVTPKPVEVKKPVESKPQAGQIKSAMEIVGKAPGHFPQHPLRPLWLVGLTQRGVTHRLSPQ